MSMRHQGIVITQTPFRISFFGGGTDFPGYFNQHGGTVIGTAIDKYTYVTINSLERFFEKRIRLSYSKHEFVDSPSELQHDIVRCILETHPYFEDRDFLDIHTFADFPASSGIGSSSSFTVGMLNAMYLLRGIYKTSEALAREAIHVERELLREAGGWQDQILAACGGLTRIHFANNNFRMEPVCLPSAHKQALQSACMMVFIGGTRSSARIQATVMQVGEKEKLEQLHKIQQSADNAFDILTNASTSKELIYEFGMLMNHAWQTKRHLSTEISNPVIDALYEKALAAGALGGKLCGAGGGGFLLFIVPPENRAAVQAVFADYKTVDIQFEDHGTRVVYSKAYSSHDDKQRHEDVA